MKKTTSLPSFLFLSLVCALILSACQSKDDLNSVDIITLTPTLPAIQRDIWVTWEGSIHADTYDLEKGPNTYCARCHSPTNWDYSAKIDAPPNCVSCKFPFEEEPRIAESNPLVPEEEWGNIGCEVCHRMNGRIADSDYAWYDNASGFYETVSSTTELCEKCHKNTETFLQHQRGLGEQTHQGYSCTNCHDPHDPYASCADKGCHSDIATLRSLPTENHLNLTDKNECLVCHPNGMDTHSMETQRNGEKNCLVCHDYLENISEKDLALVQHSKIHMIVECVACHDAEGLEVGPVEGEKVWITFRTLQSPFGASTDPYQSHNLQLKVACNRCHFENNPWKLTAAVGDSD